MFQRLKGAIDSRIAEEQARQKAAANSSTPPSATSRTGSARRSTSRTDSPSAKARRPKPKDEAAPTRGPDPAEFESAFVIEDESEPASRVGTPAIVDSNPVTMEEKSNVVAGDETEKTPEVSEVPTTQPPSELPIEVRSKLRKLEKMESKYQELLKSYRIAHKRVGLIEPFEKALKEHTPLATISDPDALIEYLNQVNLKGDMVMDEFKRVSADRDEYKKKFEEAEKEATALKEQLANTKSSSSEPENRTEVVETSETTEGTSQGVKSPVTSVLGGIFSPKQKPAITENKDVSEEFFSYDDELPQLQAEVKEKTAAIEELKSKVSELEGNLATAKESSTGLVESLEKATRELNESLEAASDAKGLADKIQAQVAEINSLQTQLETSEGRILVLEKDLAHQKKQSEEELSSRETKFEEEKAELEKGITTRDKRYAILEGLRDEYKKKEEQARLKLEALQESVNVEQAKRSEVAADPIPAATTPSLETPSASSSSAKKKNNKKKKKGGNAGASTPQQENPLVTPTVPSTSPAVDLQSEIDRLNTEVAEKDAQIERLQKKRKTEEDLREELDNVQESLLAVGQEHVEARDRIKELVAEKQTLESRITSLEKELETSKSQSEGVKQAQADLLSLTAEYEDLKAKTNTLQTDLGAAERLAADRYKDFRELRAILDKAQPEMTSLRTENASLKSAKEELATRTSELRRLEARERDLKSDMAAFKKQAADRDNEVKNLNEKITQETNGRLRAEDQLRISQRDLRRVEADKIHLSASGEKSAAELMRVQEEAGKLRVRVDELESEVTKLSSESKALRDEVELRGSQYTNTQNLLGSMRDQASEMAMQLKERKSAADSLEEELGEVQRLLGERTREGETMRRLLTDVDDRAEAKVREMRERMEAAIEERDRAEDEASTNARRKAREVDELKTKIRDFERDLKRATDDRDELARSEKEWKRKREELELSQESASKEVNEVRATMSNLKATLDGSDRQVREAEKQRDQLRRILEEANQKYEKLQKEFKALQSKQSRLTVNEVPSSRSSIDSGRVMTPPTANGNASNVYLKTILLQFLTQKDKRVKTDLVKTVLGQLLQFDKQDQEKWIATINAK